MKALLAGTAVAMLVAGPLAASPPLPVDTGIMSTAIFAQPTIGSEVRRGGHVGTDCWNPGKPIAVMDACFSAAMKQNRIANAWWSTPFDLGVYAEAWSECDIIREHPPSVDQTERKDIDQRCRYYYAQYINCRDELHVTDDQVIASISWAAEYIKPRLKYWYDHRKELAF
jgi:hypothetical protein